MQNFGTKFVEAKKNSNFPGSAIALGGKTVVFEREKKIPLRGGNGKKTLL